MKIGKAERGGTKATDQETVQKEPLQKGSSDTQPVSDRKPQVEEAAGLPGNFSPVVIQCHQPESLCATRLFLPALAHQASSQT